MPAVLSPAHLRSGILAGLLAKVPALSMIDDASLIAAEAVAERQVEMELGTRMALTTVRPWTSAAAPTHVDGEETEATYPWPGGVPGDGFIRVRPRIRPLSSVQEMAIKIPGTLIAAMIVPLTWLVLDRRNQEITIAPNSGQAILGAFLGGVGSGALMPGRVPHSIHLTYSAGLGEDGMRAWPQVKRLLELRTAIYLLAGWSVWINPTGVSTMSADGLSQTRASGYVFKDIEDRFKAEADALRDQILGVWDGPMLMVL